MEVRWRIAMVVLALVVLAACSEPTTGAQVHPGQRIRTAGPEGTSATPGTPIRITALQGVLEGEPITDGGYADPFALALGDSVYVYATNTKQANIPVLRIESASRGEYLGDALPTLPSWSEEGYVWAPAVLALPDGTYVLYYATRDTASGRMCVSRATGDSPAGPFTDDSSKAFVCPLDKGGAIDPSVYVDDDGTAYLLWKDDGDCCDLPTSIWIAPLSGDGTALTGDPVKLLDATQRWEGGVIEAPSMIKAGDFYLLFYSANAWSTADYAVGYAVCESLQGPCEKPRHSPWLRSTAHAKGPGGEEFFAEPDGVWMVYHGWVPGQVGPWEGQRRLYLDFVELRDGAPVLAGTQEAEYALARWLGGVLAVLAGMAVVVFLGLEAVRRVRHHHHPDAGTAEGA